MGSICPCRRSCGRGKRLQAAFLCAAHFLVAGILLSAISLLSPEQVELMPAPVGEKYARPLRVAFIGNSYLYFNDVPRLFQALCGGERKVEVGDCLRGGASWKVLLEQGNGMGEKFETPNARRKDGTYDVGAETVAALLSEPWDFVVMVTYSQEAARPEHRQEGLDALATLAPLLERAGARAVLLPTPAYRQPAKGSEEIGSWEDFTRKQAEGFDLYRRRLASLTSRPPALADVNRAFALARDESRGLWHDLFHTDNFHPSALGSYLEASVIYCAIFGELPPASLGVPAEPAALYSRARRMLPPPQEGRMPTQAELVSLRSLAARTSGVSDAEAAPAPAKHGKVSQWWPCLPFLQICLPAA